MSHYTTDVTLSDNRVLKVFEPDPEKDLERLVAFLSGLPQGERNNMRYNVTDRKYGALRLRMVDGVDHWRLFAEADGALVGDATMDRSLYPWTRHVADLRCAVDPSYEKLGVRAVLLKALVELSGAAGIERLCSEVLDTQPGLIASLDGLGFTREVVRKHYAKDLSGGYHDVIIMSNDREPVWRRLSEKLEDMDVQYSRMYGGE
jgi:GNAT superfamily N-acetyltransferase